jgi:hypothetical protein
MSRSGNIPRGGRPKIRIYLSADFSGPVIAQAKKEGIGPTQWVNNLIEDRLAEIDREEPDAEIRAPLPSELFGGGAR